MTRSKHSNYLCNTMIGFAHRHPNEYGSLIKLASNYSCVLPNRHMHCYSRECISPLEIILRLRKYDTSSTLALKKYPSEHRIVISNNNESKTFEAFSAKSVKTGKEYVQKAKY